MTARPLVPATRVVSRFSHEITSHDVPGYSLFRNLKAKVISTELQYYVRLKHLKHP